MTFLHLVAVVVHEYDPAIRFFVDVLGFELAEDSPSLTNDGRAKRWVVVRPPGAQTGLLLARADGEHQARDRRQPARRPRRLLPARRRLRGALRTNDCRRCRIRQAAADGVVRAGRSLPGYRGQPLGPGGSRVTRMVSVDASRR